MTNGFLTVDDFLRSKSSLSVTCRNCDHQGFLSGQFLKKRLGLYARVAEANFKCAMCQRYNVNLSAAPEQLGERAIDPKMHFAGVYLNLE